MPRVYRIARKDVDPVLVKFDRGQRYVVKNVDPRGVNLNYAAEDLEYIIFDGENVIFDGENLVYV